MAESFYLATLVTQTQLILEEQGEFLYVKLDFGERQLPVMTNPYLRKRLKEQPPEPRPYWVKLWPKTNPEGHLTPKTILRGLWPVKEGETEEKEGFHALGQLLYRDRDDARFGLTILPNLKGRLQKPFKLSIGASLELLESLPEKGSGVQVWGELKPLNLRLMARRVEAVALPPAKPVTNPPARPAKGGAPKGGEGKEKA